MDQSTRQLFENKLVKELAEMAQTDPKNIVLDECTNRDTTIGYFGRNKEWCIGTAGEFKSRAQNAADEEEAAATEEKEKKKKKEEVGRRKGSKFGLPTIAIGIGKKENEEEAGGDVHADEMADTELPPINPHFNDDTIGIKSGKTSAKAARQRRAAHLKVSSERSEQAWRKTSIREPLLN